MRPIKAYLETVSIATVTRYIVMTTALAMIVMPTGDSMAKRISTHFGIDIGLMGIAIAVGVAITILSHDIHWRFIGVIPYLLFLVGAAVVSAATGIAFHAFLIYAGYAVQLLLAIRDNPNRES